MRRRSWRPRGQGGGVGAAERELRQRVCVDRDGQDDDQGRRMRIWFERDARGVALGCHVAHHGERSRAGDTKSGLRQGCLEHWLHTERAPGMSEFRFEAEKSSSLWHSRAVLDMQSDPPNPNVSQKPESSQ